ncbi:MAG TPA: hypothetical protein VME45_14645 [Stellaceae bacterium]|nr:hypothetical protein [Stellaceae bacterium]
MSYNPDDQRIEPKQVLAGWILCLAMAGLAFAAIGQQRVTPGVNAGDPPSIAVAACCPVAGARLLPFIPCAAEPRQAVRIARGPMSLPANPCG